MSRCRTRCTSRSCKSSWLALERILIGTPPNRVRAAAPIVKFIRHAISCLEKGTAFWNAARKRDRYTLELAAGSLIQHPLGPLQKASSQLHEQTPLSRVKKSDAEHWRKKGVENFLHKRCLTLPPVLVFGQQAKPLIVDRSKAPLDDCPNEALFASEVIVNGSQVHAGAGDDGAQGSALKSMACKEFFGSIENFLAGGWGHSSPSCRAD